MSAVLVDLTLIDALGFVATKTAKIKKTLNMPPPTHWEYGNMYHYFLNVAEHWSEVKWVGFNVPLNTL